jgi:hypothetical protein
MRCGDPITAAKCKIYAAVSLMQRARFNEARSIICEQYAFAKSLPVSVRDKKLENMCLGVWAKLKYLRRTRRRRIKLSESDETVQGVMP